VIKEYIHLGIAVDTEAGLIVPVIRDAHKKSILQLSLDLQSLADKARDRKTSMEELKGGSFTISNQGGIGGGPFYSDCESAGGSYSGARQRPAETGGAREANRGPARCCLWRCPMITD
jgi:pyruvate/2-oxoglutarate dehydrogenase complex dihydrolipoamide acyltransferase (E2) component